MEKSSELKNFRRKIKRVDFRITMLLIKRENIALQIGKIKQKIGKPIYIKKLEQKRIKEIVTLAKKFTSNEKTHDLVELLSREWIGHCRKCQFDAQDKKKKKKKKKNNKSAET